MSYNHATHAPSDKTMVDLTEPRELIYWVNRFQVSEHLLWEAVRQMGSQRAGVAAYLNAFSGNLRAANGD